MPSGWNVTSLEELANKIGDGLHGTPNYDESGEFYFVNGNNIKNGKVILDSSTKKISKDEFKKLDKKLNDNSLLLSINGTIGNLAYYKNEKIALGKSAAYITLKENISRDFIFYYLSGSSVQSYFTNELTGSTIKNLSLKTIRNTKVPLPPKNEQEKIAKILSTWDEAIEKIEASIKDKERKKTYVLEYSFKKIRAKMHFRSLSELADIFPSNVDKKSHEGEKPVRLCNYVDVYKNHKITAQLNFMEATATAAEIQKFTVRKNDVIITKDSETPQDIAIPTFVAEDIKDLVCGYHLTLIRCDSSQIIGHYLYYYFLTARSKYYFFTMANGATRFGLSVDSIKECEIPIVDVTEQKKLVSALEAIEHEIELLEKYRDTIQTQKQGLMQQLLTGKKRVRV